jgi:hypothetical protein
MVGSSHIDIHTLTLDELTGVVNLYPWYAGARMELCRRMSRLGGDSWGEDEYAAQALYVADRSKLAALLRSSHDAAYEDKDVSRLLSSYLEPSAQAETEAHQVRVVGGDYFSQAQYDNVREGGDNIFSRFAGKQEGGSPDGEEVSDIADRFATETLARIFVEQGRPEEARRIYSRLVLDIPEKSAYFASLIDELD